MGCAASINCNSDRMRNHFPKFNCEFSSVARLANHFSPVEKSLLAIWAIFVLAHLANKYFLKQGQFIDDLGHPRARLVNKLVLKVK